MGKVAVQVPSLFDVTVMPLSQVTVALSPSGTPVRVRVTVPRPRRDSGEAVRVSTVVALAMFAVVEVLVVFSA